MTGEKHLIQFDADVSVRQQESILSGDDAAGSHVRDAAGREAERMSRRFAATELGRGMYRHGVSVRKPKALRTGSRLAVIAPASPGSDAAEERGRRGVAATRFFGGTRGPESFARDILRRRQRNDARNLSAR